MTQTAPARQYYPALDGLRGVAILMVVVFHNFDYIKYFGFGWLGVDLFFVISGFLITEILINTVKGKNYLKNFYLRRVLRIMPLYYLLLLIFFGILSHSDYFAGRLDYYITHQIWYWTYLQNWLYVFNPPSDANALIHLWSLAVEEQFYLIWPFIILWIRKPKILLYIVIIFLSLVIGIRIFFWFFHIKSFQNFNFFVFTRIDGICIGCILAFTKYLNLNLVKSYTWAITLGLSLCNFVFYFLNRNNSFPYFAFIGYTTFAVIFSLLIYESINNPNSVLTKIFENKVLRFLGKISYSFYIFFWPVYILLSKELQKYLQSMLTLDQWYAGLLSSIICTLIGFLISCISYYYIELKFLRLKKYLL